VTDEPLATPDPEEAPELRPTEDEAPAPKAPVIEVKSDVDERVKGFQRLLAKEQAEKQALERKLAEFEETQRLATMSEDERSQYSSRKMREELEELRARVALNDLASDYPDELPLFQQLLKLSKGGTAQDQLDAIRKWRTPAKKQEAVPDDTDVDPNNPPRTPIDEDAQVLEDGSRMTARRAASILTGSWRRTR
jgi:hypothetical protein